MFKLFYDIAMVIGVGTMILLMVVAFISFVFMFYYLFKKEKVKYSVARPLVIWLWSGLCTFGTFIQVIMVTAFTYGQGI